MAVSPKEPAPLGPSKQKRRGRLRWLRYTALGLLVLLLGAAGTLYGLARRSLPQVSGELVVGGLTSPVSVYRDEWGVPHIEAVNMHDLYFAQGFVTAQDRLWKMDMSRRLASGRIAELLGPSAIPTDKYYRTIMLRRSAERSLNAIAPATVAALDAYAAGVNAYIDQATASNRLPPEFTLLGYTPDPWTALDALTIGKYMTWYLSNTLNDDIFRYLARQKVDQSLFGELLPFYPQDGPTIMKSAADAGAPATPALAALPPDDSHIDLSGLLAAADLRDPFMGSNNWVVSGKLTKTGKPILANDPHLEVQLPAIWHQVHLMIPGETDHMNVIGAMFPGVPGIILGHNEKIAWGATNTGPDVQDLYIEKRNPANPNQFEFQGKWEDAKIYSELIKVKGQPDVNYDVVVTRHGPIISDFGGLKENGSTEAMALKWTGHGPSTEADTLVGIGRASNWEEFRNALKPFMVGTQNWVFASVDGTIAYHAGGYVPVRAKGDGVLPVPGWTGEYEWTGYIPFDAMPEVVNPPEGFIVTANNKVVDDAYRHYLTSSWAEPYRAARITEVLKSKTGFTVADMRTLQTDYTNLRARWTLPLALPHLEKAALSEPEKGALAMLKQWDYVDAADQGAPLVFQFWWRHLAKLLYEPKLGADLYKRMPDKGNITDHLLKEALEGRPGPWVQNAGGIEQLLTQSFKNAVADVATLQGSNPAGWAWGKYHRLGPTHPIGEFVQPLGWLLNAKPLPVGGSSITVGAMSYNEQTGLVRSGGVWRQVVDLADPAGNSFDVVTPGQAGHFLSPWYTSQQVSHRDGGMHPQSLSPDAYRTGKKLVLKP